MQVARLRVTSVRPERPILRGTHAPDGTGVLEHGPTIWKVVFEGGLGMTLDHRPEYEVGEFAILSIKRDPNQEPETP